MTMWDHQIKSMAVAEGDSSDWLVHHSLSSCNCSTGQDRVTMTLMGTDDDDRHACRCPNHCYCRDSMGLDRSPTVMEVVYHLQEKKETVNTTIRVRVNITI